MGQFADVARNVERLADNLDDEHETATEQGMDHVQRQLRRALSLNNSVARTVLLRDIHRQTLPSTGVTHEQIHMPEWAKFLEHGTGIHSDKGYPAPSIPPYGAIEEWFESPFGPEPQKDSQSASVQAVAETIAAEGTEAHPFIDPVWQSTNGVDLLIRRNKRAMSRALRRSF